ncbi:hypothetical protein Tco_1540952 [Tanacetum coccineum]
MYLARRSQHAPPSPIMFQVRTADDESLLRPAEAEEQLNSCYPSLLLTTYDPSAEEREPFETDESAATPPPHPAYRMTARITIPEPLPYQHGLILSPIRHWAIELATIQMRELRRAATSHSLPLPPPFILSPAPELDAPSPLPHQLLLQFATTITPLTVYKREGQTRGQNYGFVPLWTTTGDRRYVDIDHGSGWIFRPYRSSSFSTDTELGAHMRELQSRNRRGHTLYTSAHGDEAGMSRSWTSDGSSILLMESYFPTTPHAPPPGPKPQQFMHRYTTERDDSTSGTGHHPAGAGDSLTGTGDDITGAGYCLTGTAGTRWGSCTVGAAKGGWLQFLDYTLLWLVILYLAY